MKKYFFVLLFFITPALAKIEKMPQESSYNVEKYQEKSNSLLLKNKEWIKSCFKEAIENIQAKDDIYSKYFSKNYVQYVDGKTLNYEDFVNHMKAQKNIVKSIKVVFHDMVAEGNKVTTFHTAYAEKPNNQSIEMQVIAIFEITNGKIVSCNELTHLVKGKPSDENFARTD